MRSKCLLPLMVAVAVSAGCGSSKQEVVPAISKAEREIVLPARLPEVEVASPMELGRPQAQQARPVRKTPRRIRPAEPKIVPALFKLAPAAPPTAMPVSDAAASPAASEPVNDRELPPGKTITIIPASSGPSTSSDAIDELPPDGGRTLVVRGGGTCRGGDGGPGIGIAAVPRPRWR